MARNKGGGKRQGRGCKNRIAWREETPDENTDRDTNPPPNKRIKGEHTINHTEQEHNTVHTHTSSPKDQTPPSIIHTPTQRHTPQKAHHNTHTISPKTHTPTPNKKKKYQ